MSLPNAVLDEMLASGCTAEQIARAVKASNAEAEERKARKRALDADRKRRQRERETEAMSRSVTRTARDGADTSLTRVEDKPLTQKIEPQVKKESARDALRSEFEEFWTAWPNRVGKPKALAAFRAARKRAELDAILSGVRRYVLTKPLDRPWLNPATFLNQDRWADQPAAPPQARAGPERKPNIKDFFSALGTENADRPKPPETNVFLLPAAARG